MNHSSATLQSLLFLFHVSLHDFLSSDLVAAFLLVLMPTEKLLLNQNRDPNINYSKACHL